MIWDIAALGCLVLRANAFRTSLETSLRDVSYLSRAKIDPRSSAGYAKHAALYERDDQPKTATIPVDLVRNKENYLYIVEVTIGNQDFELYIDTGQSNVWALSSEVDDEWVDGHVLFDMSEYEGCPGDDFSMEFGDNGWIECETVQTPVTIGEITAPLMDFRAVVDLAEDELPRGVRVDGSLGLGPGPGSWLDLVRQAIASPQVMMDFNLDPGSTSALSIVSRA